MRPATSSPTPNAKPARVATTKPNNDGRSTSFIGSSPLTTVRKSRAETDARLRLQFKTRQSSIVTLPKRCTGVLFIHEQVSARQVGAGQFVVTAAYGLRGSG